MNFGNSIIYSMGRKTRKFTSNLSLLVFVGFGVNGLWSSPTKWWYHPVQLSTNGFEVAYMTKHDKICEQNCCLQMFADRFWHDLPDMAATNVVETFSGSCVANPNKTNNLSLDLLRKPKKTLTRRPIDFPSIGFPIGNTIKNHLQQIQVSV